jgi:hypothetical protein
MSNRAFDAAQRVADRRALLLCASESNGGLDLIERCLSNLSMPFEKLEDCGIECLRMCSSHTLHLEW